MLHVRRNRRGSVSDVLDFGQGKVRVTVGYGKAGYTVEKV
jgi:hypothetical protein